MMMMKKKTVSKKKKAVNVGLRKLIISRFVEATKINWPRDMKIAATLAKKYPNGDFWTSFILDYELPSLAFFRGKKGMDLLEYKHKEFEKREKMAPSKKKEVKMSEDKIGADYKPQKIRSMKTFLTDD